MASAESSPIVFKKKSGKAKTKAFRRQRRDSGEEEDKERKEEEASEDPSEDASEALAETRELQKLRHRAGGLSHLALGSGQKVSKVEEMVRRTWKAESIYRSAYFLNLVKTLEIACYFSSYQYSLFFADSQ